VTPASDVRRIGSRLGPFEIVARVGTGGMGEVFRARDTRLNRSVALKLLSEEFALDRHRLKRFEQEARVVSALNHPNIVTVFEIGEAESQPYIAMELVEGQTLRQLLRPGGLPFRKLLDIGIQVAEGLARAHEAGVVHRDLKPENVMVTPDGIVKILDFGLAKLTRSPIERGAGAEDGTLPLPTQPGVLLGTVRYMSPEQASGKAADFRSDQFAFGSLMYELVTGAPAFQKSTTVDTLASILHDEPEPLSRANPKVPAPLRWIIERCLAKDPRDRYAATQDLAHDLESLRLHLSEASLSGMEPLPRPSRRRRLRAVAASAAVAVLVGAAGVWAGHRLSTSPPLRFQQLTFRRGGIWSARFAPDGHTIVYGASWDGKPLELYETRIGSPETRSLGTRRADVLSVSSSGELAVRLGQPSGPLLWDPHLESSVWDPRLLFGTLAQVPIAGGAPRELLDGVMWADWGPDGMSLAVIRDSSPTERLEYPIGTVIYENEPWLNRPRVSRDGKSVAFQDLRELKIVTPPGKARALGVTADELAWSPSGDEIWYSHFDGTVTDLRAAKPSGSDRLLARLPGNYVLHDVARDGRVLLSRATVTSDVCLLREGESRPRNLSWFDRADVVAVSADGSRILFQEQGARGGIYLRATDGSPAKRLGDGEANDLSPDGKWVLVSDSGDEGPCHLLPTGAGAIRNLPATDPAACDKFLADGHRLFGMGTVNGSARRAWIRDLEGTRLRPLTPEGTFRGRVSPDGRFATALGADRVYRVYSEDGREPQEVRGLRPAEEPIQWSRDGRSLFLRGVAEAPGSDRLLVRIDRLDPWSGRREVFREIPPSEAPAGGGIGEIVISADERSVVYTQLLFPSQLFLLEGVQ
jgi:serine/threonine protein kinase/Tol biopolymer transport system component